MYMFDRIQLLLAAAIVVMLEIVSTVVRASGH
jgi:hypothetical protein